MTQKEWEAILFQRGISNWWLKRYFYVKYPHMYLAGALLIALILLSRITSISNDNYWVVFRFLGILAIGISESFMSRRFSHGMLEQAYIWSLVLYFSFPVATAFYFSFYHWLIVLGTIILFLGAVFNVVYLHKYKYLFRTYSKEEIALAVESYQARLYTELDETAVYWKAKQDAAEQKKQERQEKREQRQRLGDE